MKHYLAHWYDYFRDNYEHIEAENATEAKRKAFQMMCGRAGDRIYTVTVYEQKSVCNCDDELNPHPNSAMHKYSGRDYETGKRVTPIIERNERENHA